MEIFDENRYLQPIKSNLKGTKSPFDTSKKANKKALSDIKNVLQHHKNISFESSKPSNPNFAVSVFEKFCHDSNTPKQEKKKVSQLKAEALNRMEDDLFICEPCLHNINKDDDYDTLPEHLRLTQYEIDRFATIWGSSFSLEVDVSFEPIECNLGTYNFLDKICFETDDNGLEHSALSKMLDEDYDIMVPQSL